MRSLPCYLCEQIMPEKEGTMVALTVNPETGMAEEETFVCYDCIDKSNNDGTWSEDEYIRPDPLPDDGV